MDEKNKANYDVSKFKSSPEGKDKIMTLASQNIFSQYKTGYSTKEGNEEINLSVNEKIIEKISQSNN